MWKRLLGLLLFVALTLLTQVGGVVFAVCWLVSRFVPQVPAWRRAAINIALFAALYGVAEHLRRAAACGAGGPCAAAVHRHGRTALCRGQSGVLLAQPSLRRRAWLTALMDGFIA